MRVAFIVSYVANLALVALWLAIVPDPAAVHFRLGGTADRWASPAAAGLLAAAAYTLLFLGLLLPPRLLLLAPGGRGGRAGAAGTAAGALRARAAARTAAAAQQFGTVTFTFLFITGLLTIRANLSNPARLNVYLFYPLLMLFLGYAAVWCARLGRSFRLDGPEGDAPLSSAGPTGGA